MRTSLARAASGVSLIRVCEPSAYADFREESRPHSASGIREKQLVGYRPGLEPLTFSAEWGNVQLRSLFYGRAFVPSSSEFARQPFLAGHRQ